MAKTVYKKKLKNGKEYYFYRLRHKNLKGPKDIYATSVKELDNKIKILTNELDHGISNNKEYFGVFLKEWLYNTHLINKKASTKERYDGVFRNYIEGSPIYNIKLVELNAADIQSYYNALIKKGKTISSVKMLHKLICPCIRYAYNNSKIIKDFSTSIVLPKDKKIEKVNEVKPFSLDEQFKFINAIKGNDLEMLFITAIDTGLRQGELLALTWNDIDFDNEYIKVNKSFKTVKNLVTGKRENIIQSPKTEKGNRVVPIPNHLVNKLKKYMSSQKELRIKMANLFNNKNLVFCNIYGNYLDAANVLKRFKRILVNNNLKEIKFHDLRHTFATRLFELGENPKTVQELLGHSDISVTLDTYTHVLDDMKEKAISKLDSLYKNMGVE